MLTIPQQALWLNADMVHVTWGLKPPSTVLVLWLCLVSSLLPLLTGACLSLTFSLPLFSHYMWPLLLTELANWSCSMLAVLRWNLLLQMCGISKPALLPLLHRCCFPCMLCAEPTARAMPSVWTRPGREQPRTWCGVGRQSLRHSGAYAAGLQRTDVALKPNCGLGSRLWSIINMLPSWAK